MSHLLFAKVLRTFSDSLTFISKTKVHSRWFPYALAPTLHAARISAVYQHNARKAGYEKKLSWPTYLAGYLIMVSFCALYSHYSERLRLVLGWLRPFAPLSGFATTHILLHRPLH